MNSPDRKFQDALNALNGRDFVAAERLFRDVLRTQPGHVPALNLLTVVLISLERFAEAEPFIARAVELNQSSDVSYYNHGLIAKRLGKPDEALRHFDAALRLNANVPETWNNRGTVFNDLKQYEKAIADFDRAVALNPGYAAAICNKGKSLGELQRFDEALAAFDRALAIRPDLAEGWLGRGHVLDKLKRHEEAAAAFSRAAALDPALPFVKGFALHQRMLCCDWPGLQRQIDEIARDLDAGRPSADPFGWQAAAASEASLQRCARIFCSSRYPAPAAPAAAARRAAAHGKIRIGYLSGEFRDQATSQLIVGLLECHDRSRFEIHGFDNGWDDGSRVRHRIDAALDGMVPISRLGDQAAAGTIATREIDILVNLNGYFGEERTGVFARRPAPVQVNYLGFPGTLGASYVDYIIADRRAIPPGSRQFYDEKVVYLPYSYQPNDRNKIVGKPRSRAEYGLPDAAVVFCCFNNNYKLRPAQLDGWARILAAVEGSVLWLLKDNAAAAKNLAREAAARGIEPARLVFAERIAAEDHLARHRAADLFLDTLPYNAHTTASDALWAGLPVLTQLGTTFPGRVAASLLDAVGLPELITTTAEEYASLAIELAADRPRLASIKARLERNRLTTPLFDIQAYARHLESAYEEMQRRHSAGLAPDHIEIAT
jgi:predicted O-linked N-acetylglucosamine transferase (SPINDLY family)